MPANEEVASGSALVRDAGETEAVARAVLDAVNRRIPRFIPTALTPDLVGLVSFRLGGRDGVSVEADKWQRRLRQLGHRVVTIAGEGPVDRTLPGLAIDAAGARGRRRSAALHDADLVVVENLCSLPLNRARHRSRGERLARPADRLHHHDLPWQRERFATVTDFPPVDPAWRT